MICRDFNVRTAASPDLIVNDEIHHLPVYQGYVVDLPSTPMVSKDAIKDTGGKSILDV